MFWYVRVIRPHLKALSGPHSPSLSHDPRPYFGHHAALVVRSSNNAPCLQFCRILADSPRSPANFDRSVSLPKGQVQIRRDIIKSKNKRTPQVAQITQTAEVNLRKENKTVQSQVYKNVAIRRA